MLDTYIILIGYVAANPRYLVDTIGISTFIPCVYTKTSNTPAVRHNPNMLGSELDLKKVSARLNPIIPTCISACNA